MKKTTYFWPACTLALATVLVMGAKHDPEKVPHEEEFELAEPMGHMQRFADKLYFAGVNGNWELADFYAHEIEEQAEEIVDAGVVEDGVEMSPLAKSLLLPAIENIENSAEAKSVDQFKNAYGAMIQNCNACHVATKHAFVQIIVPTEPSIRNQNYKPLP